MYGNDNWINSYLDTGKGAAATTMGRDRPSLLLCERRHFSPARYFVEEVITGYDETDLYKTWLRANAMQSPQERKPRLDNMTRRIWNLARKKKEVHFREHQDLFDSPRQRLPWPHSDSPGQRLPGRAMTPPAASKHAAKRHLST